MAHVSENKPIYYDMDKNQEKKKANSDAGQHISHLIDRLEWRMGDGS
jgi:hypothetical protein